MKTIKKDECSYSVSNAIRTLAMVYYEEFQGKQEAMKREYAIKQLTRKEKENLIKEKNMQQKGSQDTKRGSEQNQNL